MTADGGNKMIDKINAVILYFSANTQRATFMSIAKLMYFADLMHLQRHGQTISGDQYIAMRHGPVPETAYGLLRESRGKDDFGWRVKDDYYVVAKDEPDMEIFSEKERECLQVVMLKFGFLPTWYLRHLSHDLAWQDTWEQARENGWNAGLIPESKMLEMVASESRAVSQ